jgi:hypothetical protein
MKFRISKIRLDSFISQLIELYNEGADYIDLSGTTSGKQDVLNIEESFDTSSSPIDLDGDLTEYI